MVELLRTEFSAALVDDVELDLVETSNDLHNYT